MFSLNKKTVSLLHSLIWWETFKKLVDCRNFYTKTAKIICILLEPITSKNDNLEERLELHLYHNEMYF